MNRSIRRATLSALALALAFAAPATAHVTLQPEEVPAGAFKRLDVRVPNERDDASTTKVSVRFPPGFIFVSHEPVDGWETEIEMAKLDKPVEVFGEKRTEQVDTVTFTTDGKGVRPGQFQDFGLSVGLPDRPGSTLTFKATQTYSSGEVVRWIGAPDADEPAPQVKLAASREGEEGGHSGGSGAAETVAPAGDGGGDGGGGGSDALPVIALIVGGLGLLAGIAGLTASRRARPAT